MPRVTEDIYHPWDHDEDGMVIILPRGEMLTPDLLEHLAHVGYCYIPTDVGMLYL